MTRQTTTTKALGYVRVSTSEQVDSGAGLDAQRHAIASHAAITGLDLVDTLTEEAVSGSVAPARRSALSAALDRLASGEVSTLIASKADRLSRSTVDLLTC
jgi:DNA invertase Pin-like site-specific DNA recombinase